MLKSIVGIVAVCVLVAIGFHVVAQSQDTGQQAVRSFQRDIMPILQRACLPCHAEESMNPSGLSLDSYELLIEGGKHGPPVTPGDPDQSLLMKKLGPNPPFGDRMPLQKRKSSEDGKKKITEEDLQIIKEWIKQGAKNN